MSKPPTTWKNVELRIARYLGGHRRGSDFVERDGSYTGKDDVIGLPGLSVEIKHSKYAAYGLACVALDQVDKVYSVVQHETVPVAIIHRGGLRVIEESGVCFTPAVWSKIWIITCYDRVYLSVKPLWKDIVALVTESTPWVAPLVVSKLNKNGTIHKAFVAVSLPIFKKHILPLVVVKDESKK